MVVASVLAGGRNLRQFDVEAVDYSWRIRLSSAGYEITGINAGARAAARAWLRKYKDRRMTTFYVNKKIRHMYRLDPIFVKAALYLAISESQIIAFFNDRSKNGGLRRAGIISDAELFGFDPDLVNIVEIGA